MLRHERRLLIDCLLIGTALTALVIVVDAAGMLAHLENWLYDMRARTCQHFTPKPTDKLLHLDIDDRALEVVGGWPWPRERWGRLLQELKTAGAKAVEMDVIFSEPQPVQYEKRRDGSFVEIDNDRQLAETVARMGNLVVPMSMSVVPRQSQTYRAMTEVVRDDLELEEPQIASILRARNMTVTKEDLGAQFLEARREAMMLRFATLPNFNELTFQQIRERLLPKTDPTVTSGVVRVLQEQWEKFRAWRTFERFGFPIPPGMQSFFDEEFNLVPLPPLSRAAVGGASVDYPQFEGPVIRSVPLLNKRGNQVFPQMGLALACTMLDADMHAMTMAHDELRIPRKSGPELVIPLAPPRVSVRGERVANLMDLPWFGTRDWTTMYDWPKHQKVERHITATVVWSVCTARDKIRRNNGLLDEATLAVVQLLDPSNLEKFKKSLPPLDDYASRVPLVNAVLEDAKPYFEEFAKDKSSAIPKDWETFLPSVKALKQIPELTPPLVEELRKSEKDLSDQVKDKAVLVGWVATAAVADFVPTSLHEKCPGVVVHGVVYNAIMTGEMWRRAPGWTAGASAGLLGLITAFAAGRFPPMRALLVAALLAAGFAVVNGVVLFDYGNRIVGAAAPLLAIGVAWSGCTLTRVIVETAERARITRRFSSYADPKLVNYVLEHPEVSFDGEVREMTVVFSDLVGFTSLSESLGEKIVPVLNELLGELVPVIRDHHNGYVNKFLGDGIMFFYNAPMKNHQHARDAVASVLDMHATIHRFNDRLRERGMPELAMRAGVASGDMIVGDAGGAGRNDYTVLGDVVNLGARLEPANKVMGTHTMMNARTAELLDGTFLFRPLGKLRVVGKDESVAAFEPISRIAEATPAQTMLAEHTRDVVDCFIAGEFVKCLATVEKMEQDCGPSKLTALYRKLCERYLADPPPPGFDGTIVLTEK
jgi:class 3 adenylate cyclase/CHASE2 domain-containing sensor protein